jgi:membrane fusion protein, multidrug efflux system
MKATHHLPPAGHRRVRGWHIRAALLLALSGAACSKAEAPQAPPPEIPVVPVVERDEPITIDMVGTTLGAVDIEIRARVEGYLEGMHFKEGSVVKKGQLLYNIDPREYQARVGQAQGQLAEAETLLVKATADVARYKPLAEMKAVSERDLDTALAQQGAAKGRVEAAQSTLDGAKLDLSYTRIEAPIDGLIGLSKAKVGDFVGRPPNPVILNTISDVSAVRVQFSITERDYLELMKKGAGAVDSGAAPEKRTLQLILADGSMYPSTGTVDFTNRQVDPTTGTLLVQATFPNPDRLLRPGQFARVRAVIEVKKGALLVPQRAVQEIQGSYRVFVVGDDNKIQVRAVEPGPRAGELWLITQGLHPGDRVVLEGLQKVQADQVVVPKVMAAPAASPAPAGTPPAGDAAKTTSGR